MNNIELSKLAISSPFWKWLPGMLPRHPENVPNFWVQRIGEERSARKGLIPDFDDVATRYLSLELVRMKFHDDTKLWKGRIEIHQDHQRLFFALQPYHDEDGGLSYRQIASGTTEIECIVNALCESLGHDS